jgi:hypothetical protein
VRLPIRWLNILSLSVSGRHITVVSPVVLSKRDRAEAGKEKGQIAVDGLLSASANCFHYSHLFERLG